MQFVDLSPDYSYSRGAFVSVKRDNPLHISKAMSEEMGIEKGDELVVAEDKFEDVYVGVVPPISGVPSTPLAVKEDSCIQTNSQVPSNKILSEDTEERKRLHFTGNTKKFRGVKLYEVE